MANIKQFFMKNVQWQYLSMNVEEIKEVVDCGQCYFSNIMSLMKRFTDTSKGLVIPL